MNQSHSPVFTAPGALARWHQRTRGHRVTLDGVRDGGPVHEPDDEHHSSVGVDGIVRAHLNAELRLGSVGNPCARSRSVIKTILTES